MDINGEMDGDGEMDSYDPLVAPDPGAWQSLDEGERIYLVEEYHRKDPVKPPNAHLHAGFHVVVENQVAMGDEIPVRATLERLMREGLDRHDAIHAIGSVLAEYMHNLAGGAGAPASLEKVYYKRLKKLKAAKWLKDCR